MRLTASLIAATFLLASPAFAADAEYRLVIKDHKFSPETIELPANTKVKLKVKNEDATPEEFESHNPKLEKIIPGNTEATLNVPALKPGEYKFFGEFNEKTAQGKFIVK